jgi:hypothetical protein
MLVSNVERTTCPATLSHFQSTGIPVRQKEEKMLKKQYGKTEMVGPEGLEPPTKRL